jgi:hypothetical protein
MAIPTSREQLKQYCLRRLGSPVIDINVDDEQLEDRIDDALIYFRDFHYDGTEHIYLPIQVTAQMKQDKYVPLEEDIIGVVNVFPLGDAFSTNNLFNVRYQFFLNDLFNITSSSITPYVMAMRHIETLQEVFNGKKPLRFNRHQNKVYIDMDWKQVVADNEYIILECYKTVDPEVYTDVWGDKWLLRYTTALFKRQWGENLKKFQGIQLPGGLTFNGQQIFDEAQQEIVKLEDEMINTNSLPVADMTG